MKVIVVGMEVGVMTNIVKQIIVGLTVAIGSTAVYGTLQLYDSIQLNTKHRVDMEDVSTRIEENHQILIRLEANQKFLLERYHKDSE